MRFNTLNLSLTSEKKTFMEDIEDMEETKRKIAENLKRLRIDHNLSQEQVGEGLGKREYTSYQRLEHGKSDLKFVDAVNVAKMYNIPMEWIFDPELRNTEEGTSSETSRFKKNSSIQITLTIDGTEETLMKQFEILKNFNQVLSKS